MNSPRAGDLVTVLANSSTLAAFGAVGCLLVAAIVARRRWPEHLPWWRIAAAGSFGLVLAVTQLPTRSIGAIREVEISGSPGRVLRWPFDGVDLDTTFASAGWWLNIMLFVPLGLCVRGMLADRRLRVCVAVIGAAAWLVESGQALTGFRSADLADFAANLLGGVAGCALVTLARPIVGRLGRWTRRRSGASVIAWGGAVSVALIVLVGLVLVESADRAQSELLGDLESRFSHSSIETMSDVFFPPDGDSGAFERFLAEDSIRPDSIVRTELPRTAQARYPEQSFGLHRCVFVVWRPGGVDFRRGSGSECVEFLGS